MLKFSTKSLLIFACLSAVVSCSGQKSFEVNLMSPPDVYDEDSVDPFVDATPIRELPYAGILYATDRTPAGEGDNENFYLNDRGNVLRLGRADVELRDADISWEEARKISLLKNAGRKYPIGVSGVEEYGILDRTATPFLPPEDLGAEPEAGARTFAEQVNAKLAISKQQDIYIYVHGYKVVFENPVLVATELWHFLGYDGVFIAYSWPSTPSKWAYLKDTETAAGFARNLRILIEYLAEETTAESIHVLGYSAGTRLVSRAFEQLALIHKESTPEEIQAELRIGNLILVGSDIDKGVFGSYLADGLMEVPRRLTIYISDKDKALGMSKFLTRRDRLGQTWADSPQHLDDYLNEKEAVFSVVNVTGAKDSDFGNGHAYFRESPWASSDILMTLRYELTPEERGLELKEGTVLWEFPPDYIDRLRAAIKAAYPSYSAPSD
jgi:esterase/lipase superfamily enzyme